ncbi:MAG: AtpZ/AtpI family protein [Deltaproteobacteria bacterium]|nr:AtpZ/AtpI family protein [Deltaproteobacteria bacterium]
MLQKPSREVWEQWALTMQVGLTFAGSMLFCFAIGYWLDRWLGTKGLLIVVGLLLGVAGGGYMVYRQIMEALPMDDRKGPGPDGSAGRTQRDGGGNGGDDPGQEEPD